MDRRELSFWTAGILGKAAMSTYFPMVRCVREDYDNLLDLRRRKQPFVGVYWHGQLLPMVHFHKHQGIAVLSSEHRDSEYMVRVTTRLGYHVCRGSSTRGGVKGLKGLIRAAKDGRDLALTPDGPKGPRHVFKPGALVAAQLTGLPILPIGAGADRAWYLNSWDRFMIPKPFSTLRIRYGVPREVPRRATDDEFQALVKGLEEDLNRFALELNPAEAQIRKELNEKGR